MRRLKSRPFLYALFLAFTLTPKSRAQFPSLRATDTRTSTPESVMGLRKDWGTDLSFGGSFNRGNTNVDYMSTSFDLFKAMAPSTMYLSGSMVYNTFGDKRVLNQGSMTARYDHAWQGPLKWFLFNTNAYNEFIQLNYRTTTGIGPWYDFNCGQAKHGVSLAAAHEYERFKGGLIQRAGRFSFRTLSQVPISPVAQVRADLFYIPKMDEIGNYRLFAEIALETIFWKDYLGVKLSWIDEYDNRPRPGVKTNDTLWLTSLIVHLGK